MAVTILKLCTSGVLTEGKLSARARELVVASLSRPGFLTGYVAHLAQSGEKPNADAAMAELMQTLAKSRHHARDGIEIDRGVILCQLRDVRHAMSRAPAMIRTISQRVVVWQTIDDEIASEIDVKSASHKARFRIRCALWPACGNSVRSVSRRPFLAELSCGNRIFTRDEGSDIADIVFSRRRFGDERAGSFRGLGPGNAFFEPVC